MPGRRFGLRMAYPQSELPVGSITSTPTVRTRRSTQPDVPQQTNKQTTKQTAIASAVPAHLAQGLRSRRSARGARRCACAPAMVAAAAPPAGLWGGASGGRRASSSSPSVRSRGSLLYPLSPSGRPPVPICPESVTDSTARVGAHGAPTVSILGIRWRAVQEGLGGYTGYSGRGWREAATHTTRTLRSCRRGTCGR